MRYPFRHLLKIIYFLLIASIVNCSKISNVSKMDCDEHPFNSFHLPIIDVKSQLDISPGNSQTSHQAVLIRITDSSNQVHDFAMLINGSDHECRTILKNMAFTWIDEWGCLLYERERDAIGWFPDILFDNPKFERVVDTKSAKNDLIKIMEDDVDYEKKYIKHYYALEALKGEFYLDYRRSYVGRMFKRISRMLKFS
jgi:hypothetical protein